VREEGPKEGEGGAGERAGMGEGASGGTLGRKASGMSWRFMMVGDGG